MDVKITEKSRLYYVVYQRLMNVHIALIKVGILKANPYPDHPKWCVGRVGGVNEAKYGWQSRAVDSHPGIVDEVGNAVLRAITDPERDRTNEVKKALVDLRDAMRESLDELGLVNTGFLRKNVKYTMGKFKWLMQLSGKGK